MKLSNVVLTMFLSSWFLMGCGTENSNISISGNQENMGNGSGNSNNSGSSNGNESDTNGSSNGSDNGSGNTSLSPYNRKSRISEVMAALGIPIEFHVYEGLPHGFGLGTGTVAEGWIKDAVKFWEKQMKTSGTTGIRNIKY